MPKVGDLIPHSSGTSHLGVDGTGSVQETTFDISSLAPFGHIHQVSGVFHDPLLGQSGVIRYNLNGDAGPCFEISVDGGLTFDCLASDNNVVTSVGVKGDVNLTGNVDLASPGSGFIVIEDSSNASPLLFSVDQLGLSGLWDFPAQGFNGRVVNSLVDFHGTELTGEATIVGASGIIVDIVGQTITIGAAAEQIRCYTETFGSSNTWTATHNLGTTDVVAMLRDETGFMFVPDKLEVQSTSVVEARHNVPVAGTMVIIACLP